MNERRKHAIPYHELAELAVEQFGAENLPKGYDRRYAWRDVSHCLNEFRETIMLNAGQFVAEETMRLDEMFYRVWAKAFPGDKDVHNPSVSILLRIMERKAKMLGLDEARKLAVTHTHIDAATEQDRLDTLKAIFGKLQSRVGDEGMIALKQLGVQDVIEVAPVEKADGRERVGVEGRGDQGNEESA